MNKWIYNIVYPTLSIYFETFLFSLEFQHESDLWKSSWLKLSFHKCVNWVLEMFSDFTKVTEEQSWCRNPDLPNPRLVFSNYVTCFFHSPSPFFLATHYLYKYTLETLSYVGLDRPYFEKNLWMIAHSLSHLLLFFIPSFVSLSLAPISKPHLRIFLTLF